MTRSGVVAADESVLGLSAGVSVSDSGLNGGSSRRWARASQSMLAKKAWRLISSTPLPPSRCDGSRTRSYLNQRRESEQRRT